MSKKPAPKKKPGSQAPGTRASLFKYSPFAFVIIGLDTSDGPEHPAYDERIKIPLTHPKLAALIKSIMRSGVRSPVGFKRDGELLIAQEGRQRIRCAREAVKLLIAEGLLPKDAADPASENAFEIPALPWGGDDQDLFVLSREMNALRVEDPVAATMAIAVRLSGWGKTDEYIADRLGVTPQTVREWKLLHSASAPVRRAWERGEISATAGARLARLASVDQAPALAELTKDGKKPTAHEAANKVRERSGKAPVETPAQKLKRITDLVDDYQTSLLHMNPEQQEDAHAGAFSCLTKIRSIVHPPAVNRMPPGDRPRLAHPAEQETEFGA